MRLTLIAIAAVAATLAADVTPSSAQESFFNKRFCTRGGGDRGGSGAMDCSFNTWGQCMASAQGLGRYCIENPWWRTQGSGANNSRRNNGRQRGY